MQTPSSMVTLNAALHYALSSVCVLSNPLSGHFTKSGHLFLECNLISGHLTNQNTYPTKQSVTGHLTNQDTSFYPIQQSVASHQDTSFYPTQQCSLISGHLTNQDTSNPTECNFISGHLTNQNTSFYPTQQSVASYQDTLPIRKPLSIPPNRV